MQSRVFTFSNAIVRVHIPDVAESEKARNFIEVKQAAEMLLREVIKAEKNH